MVGLPKKKEGDQLGAGHVNQLSLAAERVNAQFVRGFSPNTPPFIIRKVKITNILCGDDSDSDLDNDGDPDWFTIRFKYWDAATSSWLIDDRGDGYCLDASQNDQAFSVGDEVDAYWDPQRGAFVPISVDTSSPAVNSGTCGCLCIDTGDIVVDTYETTSRFAVSLPMLEIEETFGRVVLPAAEHLLDYDVGLSYWIKDISSELIAYYNSGNDYVITPTPTATIIFRHADGSDMSLEITWPDNLVPEE